MKTPSKIKTTSKMKTTSKWRKILKSKMTLKWRWPNFYPLHETSYIPPKNLHPPWNITWKMWWSHTKAQRNKYRNCTFFEPPFVSSFSTSAQVLCLFSGKSLIVWLYLKDLQLVVFSNYFISPCTAGPLVSPTFFPIVKYHKTQLSNSSLNSISS